VQLGQNPDEVDVAETANEERDAEKHNTELQTHRKKDLQLSFRKIFITHLPAFCNSGIGGIWVVFCSN